MELKAVTFVLCSLMVFRTSLVEARCQSFDVITNNLREVVIGKCEVFQQTINQDIFCSEGFRNCTNIWDAVSRGFLNMGQCDGPTDAYADYINLTDHTVPRDMSLFWENVYPFVSRYSNQGYKRTSISDTLTGYIGDGLNWCTDSNNPDRIAPPGSLCPGWVATPECPQSAVHRFWAASSKRYAEKASGHVDVMLNASVVPIYANTTYLAVFELPYLRTGIVTKTTVLLLNEQPVKDTTKCDDPSLLILANQMKAKNIAFECIENPRDVADLLCLQDSSLGLCSSLTTTNSASTPSFVSSLLLAITLIHGLLNVFNLIYSLLKVIIINVARPLDAGLRVYRFAHYKP